MHNERTALLCALLACALAASADVSVERAPIGELSPREEAAIYLNYTVTSRLAAVAQVELVQVVPLGRLNVTGVSRDFKPNYDDATGSLTIMFPRLPLAPGSSVGYSIELRALRSGPASLPPPTVLVDDKPLETGLEPVELSVRLGGGRLFLLVFVVLLLPVLWWSVTALVAIAEEGDGAQAGGGPSPAEPAAAPSVPAGAGARPSGRS
jgi:hypothetical protein